MKNNALTHILYTAIILPFIFIGCIELKPKTKSMSHAERENILRTGSMFWSKLGWGYDPPVADEKGEQILFGDLGQWTKYHNNFNKAGIKIHTTIIPSGWVGVDKFDYRATDKVLDSLFKDNPDIMYIPRIKLNVPVDWGKKYPEELFVYFGGPHDVEGIRELVGTLKQDLLGIESAMGYAHFDHQKDPRPNVGGLISNQSFASKRWLNDAGIALRNFIQHLKNGPYADKILGYHIAYGTFGETVLWGRISNRFGDYGIAARKAFYNWGLKKYGSLENLRKVWMQPKLTLENIEIPPPEMRENRSDSLQVLFRATPEDQICIDLDLFMSDVNADAIEYFGKIVKDETNGQALAGSFYGYFLEVARSAYTGHLAIERLLNSPDIDFLAGPASYYRRGAGEPGGELSSAQSINRKKIWVSENDLGSFIIKTRSNTQTFIETRTEFWREFAKNTSHGTPQWWMDLVGGTYDSIVLLQEVQKIEDTYHLLNTQKAESISEILLVVDEQSFFHWSANSRMHDLFMKEFVREATLCGAPVDMYRLSDLEEIDLSQYKLITFVNPFMIFHAQWETIRGKIPANATLLWFYTPGILSPEFDLSNVFKITGFNIKEKNRDNKSVNITFTPDKENLLKDTPVIEYQMSKDYRFPLVYVTETEEQSVLARYDDGRIAGAFHKGDNGQLNFYFSLPILKAKHFRLIAEMAGCHFYAPSNCTVYADNRFIGIFPKEPVSYGLDFISPIDIKDAITGEFWKNIKTIPIKMDAKSAKFFLIK